MTIEELEQVIYERTRDFVSRRVMDCILELISEEREACAKMCEDIGNGSVSSWYSAWYSGGAYKCADEIRKRGEVKP